jgi:hypothetical protein
MEKSELILEDIVFPVVKTPVFTLMKGKTDKYIRIPGKIALIDSASGNPLSVVSNDYELITNEQAYEYAQRCMRVLFDMKENSEIELYNIIVPKSRSFCHIDLFADKRDFKFQTKDEYKPFVRVTNSYNAMFRLSFNVGFCRSICRNGVIFGEESIRFKFSHTRDFKREINFEIHKNGFEILLNKFKSDIDLILSHTMPKEYLFPMFCKSLGLNFDLDGMSEKEKTVKLENIKKTKKLFDNILSKYTSECGDNYYALYNAVTEVATFGFEEENLYVTRVNSRQKRAGVWLSEISELLRNGEIDYEVYLKDFLEISRN